LIVVDASLFAAWLLNESRHGPEDDVWDLLSAKTIFVPHHWPNEIANAMRKAVRTKRLSPEEIPLIAQRVRTFDIDFAEPTSIDDIADLAREALHHGLSAYDMTYIRVAREHHFPLATVDRAMRSAAQRLQIPILPR
jgi:predicted nucleic acid-binding protein